MSVRIARRASANAVRTLMLALLSSACLLVIACGRVDGELVPNAPPDDPGIPAYGGSISVALEAETNNWLPGHGAFAEPGTNVALAIYDSLARRDHEGRVRPYLAESIEPNDDYTVWTLRLRHGVRFHDGTPLDAEAIKWNFDRLHKAPGSNTSGAVRDVMRVDVVDPLTVEYHLARGIVAFPDLLTGAIGWPFSPTAHARYGDDAGLHPVGTGPFEFVSWRRDDRLVVRRNEHYWWDGLPYLDEIVFRPIPDEDSRLASLVSRNVDAMQSLRQSIVAQVRRTPGIHRYEFVGNNGGGSIFNTRRPPVDDVRVRRALALSLHQESLIEVLGGTDVTPPKTQWFSETSQWYSPRVAAAWPDTDLEAARDLLDAYVNDPDRSDRQPPGAPVAIEYICPPDPSLMEFSQVHQAFWRAAGFQVRLRQVEQATQIQTVIAGDYMITCWRAGGQADPYIVLSNAFGPPDEQPLNFTNFTHPVIDGELEALRTETAFERRYAAVERIMLLLAQEVPSVWAGATPIVVAVRPEIRNVDGWRLPDGTLGEGIPGSQVVWGQVWRQPGDR
jgi:peptide/nickel transport system substrate-binding protein